jgi:ectoine hydroxylase-related dioxygenase (phytanoyl-CoA dioxygenase family)
MTPEQVLAHPARVMTEAQRRDFFRDGFATLPGLIDAKTCAALRGALAEIAEIARERPGSDADFTVAPGHSAAKPLLITVRRVHDMHPAFWRFAARSRLPDLAADLVGPDVKFREAYVNLKRARDGEAVSWHQDFPFFPMTNRAMVTTLTYLDDVTPDMGPIAVVPGSHRGPLFDHYDPKGQWSGRLAEGDEARAGLDRAAMQPGPAGTVVVFDSCMLHGSAPNVSGRDRPVLVMGYAAADAFPYTATPPSMLSPRTWQIVRGKVAPFAHHEAVSVRVPPDWSHNAYVPPDWPEGTNQGMN